MIVLLITYTDKILITYTDKVMSSYLHILFLVPLIWNYVLFKRSNN